MFLTLVLAATVAAAPRNPQPNPAPGSPLPNLTAAQLAAFNSGKTEFTDDEEVEDGLGPVFNGRACGECHTTPAVGGAGVQFVTRFGARTNGAFDPLASFGGSLIQTNGIGPADGSAHQFAGETVPAAANVTAKRRTTSLLGLGFVDATPDSDFFALAQMQSSRKSGVNGRVALVTNISAGMKTVGKFGWKNQNPTLFQFAGDAYLNEMGITNPQFASENCPNGNCAELAFNPFPAINDTGDGVEELTNFMTMLAAPPRANASKDANDGEQLFSRIGCDECHVATLKTGPSPIAALDRKPYHPYSDFLLHDMGSLGDGIEQGPAGVRDMRTAPLWGLRFLTAYLHDGRATSFDDAILAHDGEAKSARNKFAALDEKTKAKLREFLKSL